MLMGMHELLMSVNFLCAYVYLCARPSKVLFKVLLRYQVWQGVEHQLLFRWVKTPLSSGPRPPAI